MVLNVIKQIEITKADTVGEWCKEQVRANWRQAGLYEIEKKPVVELLYKNKHISYLVKK